MIDEKILEKSLKLYEGSTVIDAKCRAAYIKGAKEFKEDLWHSPSEEPSLDEYHQIVLEWYENAAGRKDKMRYAIIDNNYMFWSSVLSTYAIVKRWFYLDDLL